MVLAAMGVVTRSKENTNKSPRSPGVTSKAINGRMLPNTVRSTGKQVSSGIGRGDTGTGLAQPVWRATWPRLSAFSSPCPGTDLQSIEMLPPERRVYKLKLDITKPRRRGESELYSDKSIGWAERSHDRVNAGVETRPMPR